MNFRLGSILLLIFSTLLSSAVALAQSEVAINKRPLREFAQSAGKKIDAGEVDLKASFRIEFNVALDGSAKIDVSKSKVTKIEGDERSAGLAKGGIVAVGESGFFGYLSEADDGPKMVLVTVGQTDETFGVAIKVETRTEEQAKLKASAFRSLFVMGTHAASPEDRVFLEKSDVVASGRSYVLTMKLPGEVLRARILAELGKKAKSE